MMHEQAFATLEYDKLRALVRRGAQTPMGRARVEELAPIDDLQKLRRELMAVAECVELRRRGVSWSFSEMADPAEALARLRIEGATLEPLAMLGLGRLCEQALAARAVVLSEREACPVLWETVEHLPRELHSLVARVSNKILPSGELDDRASPELARIRSEITSLRSRITRSLESLMRRSEVAIQDELVTVRNDRFVIPVKSDHRGRVSGVAHGFSSSGATIFVEPLETIEANNELQALRETEEREVYKILTTLTEELRRELPAIEMSARAVAELDFVNAKRVLFERFNCVVPEISESNSLELVEARHPLLEENLRAAGAAVVPVSFSLDKTHPVMVISGANAGGKTVVLKTTGLLSLMALSALPVPARSARFPFYASVLADIGDHQSLAANLSTFTSHVANISRMIELCTPPALVLFDEVGTGTDPEEGSALGVAVVDHFRRACGAHVLATTHYSGLKMYAANEEAVINASVEFDEKTLQPTYRLLVGIAGASSGIEIARRFGFPEEIVRAAAGYVGESARDAALYLQRIKREAEEAENLRRALDEERLAVAEKYSSLDMEAQKRERERQATFEREFQKAVADFEKRSRELVARVEDRAERAKVEREAQKRAAELKREAQSAARAVSRTTYSSPQQSPPPRSVRVVRDGKVVNPAEAAPVEEEYRVSDARPIAVGDRVRMRSFGSIGIVDKISNDEAEVRVKALRFREKLANLELVEAVQTQPQMGRLEKLQRASSRGTEVRLSAPEEIRAELNVIGRTTDEAVDEADKFLDEAFMNSLQHVRIVHGHGTGALRKAIGDFLRNHPHVERFSPAPQNQGGAGATVVELKQ
ncbi:MAG: mismatch repair protein MutS2 [Acidobacteriota bacterium]|jgi:DNA mismatch repair protein MutS2|nr:mismatch repair protein MutS2 [Acidobacteriota bacterium]